VEALALAFTIHTSYFFSSIKADCVNGSCKVFVNDVYKDSYKYQMNGDIAYTNIAGKNITFNTTTKELSWK